MREFEATDLLAGGFDRRAFRRRIVRWFGKRGRDLPWRRTADPYAILVAEFMLQQTQVAAAEAFFARWMSVFPTVAQLAAADEQEVLQVWQGLGYYSRARNLHRAAKVIVHEHGGCVPKAIGELESLPGIGRYTAAAVAAFAFDIPAAVLDANVVRVLARVFDFRERVDSASGRRFLEDAASSLQPERGGRLFNSALMELGALVCRPRVPRCAECPVRGICAARDPATLPVKGARPKTVHCDETALLIVHENCVLLEQETGRRRTGLWKLPIALGGAQGKPLVQLGYPITHYRVRLSVFQSNDAPAASGHLQWFRLDELEGVPMPSPYRRAINQAMRRLTGLG